MMASGNQTDFSRSGPPAGGQDFLEGQMLIAMPGMMDPRFEKTVIYLCAHSENGAMGFVVNKQANDISFEDLADQFDIEPKPLNDPPRVHIGGPVDSSRGFVLHTSDYVQDSSTVSDENGIALTATLEIVKEIAEGRGPRNAVLALGYSGWGPGQLESEIKENGWLFCDADEELIFAHNNEDKWSMALRKAGINVSHLSTETGQA